MRKFLESPKFRVNCISPPHLDALMVCKWCRKRRPCCVSVYWGLSGSWCHERVEEIPA